VGFSLLLLPIGVILGSILFLVLPELSAVVVIKAMDGSLKQSVHKSASELLALPLPFDLKNRTKSFIDVVVDSIATGLAGCLLLFVVKAFELPSYHIAILIIGLVLIWIFFIGQVRKEYYKTFRQNLELLTKGDGKPGKFILEKASVVNGMRSVFKNGKEEQILFMLEKLMEINDKRFEDDVMNLLKHPSTKVRTAALKNLYFLNNAAMISNIDELLNSNDQELTVATLEYLLKHAASNSNVVYDLYLNHDNAQIAEAALYCLAWEARDNPSLKLAYRLRERIFRRCRMSIDPKNEFASLKMLLKILGAANLSEFYPMLSEHLVNEHPDVKRTAIVAAGMTMDARFVG
jgi:AAA family ATP:ADP antiporter